MGWGWWRLGEPAPSRGPRSREPSRAETRLGPSGFDRFRTRTPGCLLRGYSVEKVAVSKGLLRCRGWLSASELKSDARRAPVFQRNRAEADIAGTARGVGSGRLPVVAEEFAVESQALLFDAKCGLSRGQHHFGVQKLPSVGILKGVQRLCDARPSRIQRFGSTGFA